jgi:hypothetical protein
LKDRTTLTSCAACGIRPVILTNPTPNTGARLVKAVYRVEAQARALR